MESCPRGWRHGKQQRTACGKLEESYTFILAYEVVDDDVNVSCVSSNTIVDPVRIRLTCAFLLFTALATYFLLPDFVISVSN